AIPLLTLGRWLEARGLKTESARPIVRELLRRAAASSRPVTLDHLVLVDQLRLPASEAGQPLDEGIAIAVGPDALEVFGHPTLAMDGDDGSGAAMTALFDILTEAAEQAHTMSRRTGITWEGSILVVADRDTPWQTLLRIFATAESAGFAYGKIVVLTDQPF